MSITLPTTDGAVSTAAPDTAAKRVPVAGGEPVTTDGVTLAVCAREGETDPVLCRLSTSGSYRPTGRVIDFARALAAGLIVTAPAKPAKPAAAAPAAPAAPAAAPAPAAS
jgi:2-oxoglutarate dehydrogenase E2 component (dihydrolipoamide succinyltransferase)